MSKKLSKMLFIDKEGVARLSIVQFPFYKKVDISIDPRISKNIVYTKVLSEKTQISITKYSSHLKDLGTKYTIKKTKPNFDVKTKDMSLGLGKFKCTDKQFNKIANEAFNLLRKAHGTVKWKLKFN